MKVAYTILKIDEKSILEIEDEQESFEFLKEAPKTMTNVDEFIVILIINLDRMHVFLMEP